MNSSTSDFHIEPLSGDHERTALSCEVAPLERYLKEQADHAKASPELVTFGYVKLPLSRARSKRLLDTVALISPFETLQAL